MKKEMISRPCLLIVSLLLISSTGGCDTASSSLKVTKAEEKQFFAHPTSAQTAQMNRMREEGQAKAHEAAIAAAATQQTASTKQN